MENTIFQMLADSIGASGGFFTLIMDSIGGIGQVWLAYVLLHLLFRFIISPVFGSAGSDFASAGRSDKPEKHYNLSNKSHSPSSAPSSGSYYFKGKGAK